MSAQVFIGTSGWHYNDWIGTFYPPEVIGYHERIDINDTNCTYVIYMTEYEGFET